MEYEPEHYYRVKYALLCACYSFLKEPPKDDCEEYARNLMISQFFCVYLTGSKQRKGKTIEIFIKI